MVLGDPFPQPHLLRKGRLRFIGVAVLICADEKWHERGGDDSDRQQLQLAEVRTGNGWGTLEELSRVGENSIGGSVLQPIDVTHKLVDTGLH